jgi:hypothetical protein
LLLVVEEDGRGGKSQPELERSIDHEFLFGDDLGAAGHAPEMMAGIAVVVLDSDGVGLADDLTIRRQVPGESVPIVDIEDAVRQVLDLVVEPPEGCSITTACNPGHGSPCATIHRLDDPELVFFEPMKCHISSNSISLMSPGTSGSGKACASSLIQR